MGLFSRAPKPPARSPPQSASQPTCLEVFASSSSGLPADEAIMKANAAGVVMASNKRLSEALVGSEEWKTIQEAFPCWSGTMTAYVEPGKTFRESSEQIASIDNAHYIVYTNPDTNQRWLFRIPEDYLDKKDSILVVEHPNFQLISEGNDWIVRAAFVDLVEKFPAVNGWHIGDPKYDIPQGNAADASNDVARYPWRIAMRVGLLSRGYDLFVDGYRRRGVGLAVRPSFRLGVAVQHPASGSQHPVPGSQHPVFDPNALNNYREPAGLLGPDGKPIPPDGESETWNPRAMTKQGFGLFARARDMMARALGLDARE